LSNNSWIRGTCQYGIIPANGLIYAPTHVCGCYFEAMVRAGGTLWIAGLPKAEERASAASDSRIIRNETLLALSRIGPAFEE
jgi:hypothetical protein